MITLDKLHVLFSVVIMFYSPSSGPHGQSNGGYDKSASASGYANPSSVPPGAAQKGKKENKEHKKGKDGEKPVAVYAQIDQSKRKPKQPVSIYDKVERENRKVQVKTI